MIGDVGVDDGDAALGGLQELLGRVADGMVARAGDVDEHGGPDATLRRRLQRGEQRVQRVRACRKLSSLAEPGREEHGLELGDDGSLDPGHRVVELLVVEVVLDAAPADVPDPPVHHHHLAVIEVTQVVEPRIEPAGSAEGAVDVGAEALVHHDRHPAVHELAVELLGPHPHLAAEAVDGQAHGHPPADLRDQGVAELAPDVAHLEAVDEEVDRGGRPPDVLEHAREVLVAMHQGLNPRGQRGRVGNGQVPPSDVRNLSQSGDPLPGPLGADRVGSRRVCGHSPDAGPCVDCRGGRRDGGAGRHDRDARPVAHACSLEEGDRGHKSGVLHCRVA